MTNKMTRKDLLRYDYIITTGYCGLQNLTRAMNEDGYNYGVYGWNWTVYNRYGIGIIDSYRNVPAYAIVPDYELMKKYNDMGYGKTLEERLIILDEFIKEVLKNE